MWGIAAGSLTRTDCANPLAGVCDLFLLEEWLVPVGRESPTAVFAQVRPPHAAAVVDVGVAALSYKHVLFLPLTDNSKIAVCLGSCSIAATNGSAVTQTSTALRARTKVARSSNSFD